MLQQHVDEVERRKEIAVLANERVVIVQRIGIVHISRYGEYHHDAISNQSLPSYGGYDIIAIEPDILFLHLSKMLVKELLLGWCKLKYQVCIALLEAMVER